MPLGWRVPPPPPPPPGMGAATALEFFPALSCEVDPAFFRTMRIPLLKGREFTDLRHGGVGARGHHQPRDGHTILVGHRSDWPSYATRTFVSLDDGRRRRRQHQTLCARRQCTVRVRRAVCAGRRSAVAAPDSHRCSRCSSRFRKASAQPGDGGGAQPSRRARNRQGRHSAGARMSIRRCRSCRSRRCATALDNAIADRRFLLGHVVVFAALALLLAAVGVYAVTSHLVRRRARELSIRAALGARSGHLVWLAMRDGIMVAAIGVLFGALISITLTPQLGGFLYEVSPWDSSTFLSVALILVPAVMCASVLPGPSGGEDRSSDCPEVVLNELGTENIERHDKNVSDVTAPNSARLGDSTERAGNRSAGMLRIGNASTNTALLCGYRRLRSVRRKELRSNRHQTDTASRSSTATNPKAGRISPPAAGVGAAKGSDRRPPVTPGGVRRSPK